MIARKRLFSTWMAILAIVLNALLPTLSLAFDTGRTEPTPAGGNWIEICSVSGSSWVLLDADGQLLARSDQQPEGVLAGAHVGHCPYCLTHAASFGLPPAPDTGLFTWSGMRHHLAHPGVPFQTHLVWLTPAARAPPHHL